MVIIVIVIIFVHIMWWTKITILIKIIKWKKKVFKIDLYFLPLTLSYCFIYRSWWWSRGFEDQWLLFSFGYRKDSRHRDAIRGLGIHGVCLAPDPCDLKCWNLSCRPTQSCWFHRFIFLASFPNFEAHPEHSGVPRNVRGIYSLAERDRGSELRSQEDMGVTHRSCWQSWMSDLPLWYWGWSKRWSGHRQSGSTFGP